MSIDAKQFLRAHSTPLGLVESDEGREAIRFEDAAGMPCLLSCTETAIVEPAGLNAMPPPVKPLVFIAQGQAVIALNAEKVQALSETLQRWLATKSFTS